MVLTCCLNGARLPGEHPALPATPEQLDREARRAVRAGAGAVHLHAKSADGADTLAASAMAQAVAAVRAATPGTPIGVTTGAWAVTDPHERAAAVRSWAVLPDVASVNWHEPGAEEVAETLRARGVGVEAGLWHLEAVDAWLASPLRHHCDRVLLELPDGLDEGSTETEARALLSAARGGISDGVPVLLHGEGTSCWPALRLAGRLGLEARIGLEDVSRLPDGSPAADNAALVAAAVDVLRSERAP